MKILKEGIKPTKSEKKSQKEYIKKCRNCKCVFIYQRKDTLNCWDAWNMVRCPSCDYLCDIIIPRRYRKNIVQIDKEFEEAQKMDGR